MNFNIDDIVNSLYNNTDNSNITKIEFNQDKEIDKTLDNNVYQSVQNVKNNILHFEDEKENYPLDKIQSVSDILGDYKPNTVNIRKNISKEYENLMYKDNDHLRFIASDVELFTKLKEDVTKSDDTENDIWALENLRIFSKDFLKSRGFLYCKDVITLMNKFPYLKDSSVLQNFNDVYEDRYVYPICLPSGKVFTHMGYNVERLLHSLNKVDKNSNYVVSGIDVEISKLPSKYQIVSHLWVNQMNLIGNMESLGIYDGDIVYCVEGYFDALRINDEFGKKSIAILGSKLTSEKRTILYQLKRNGCTLVYIPDEDEAGLSDIINDNIWDYIYRNPIHVENRDDNFVVKDVDSYVVNEYLKNANILYRDIDLNVNLHDMYKNRIKIPFHEISMLDTIKSLRNKNMY